MLRQVLDPVSTSLAVLLLAGALAGQAAHALRFPRHVPSFRYDTAAAYSAVRNRAVLFGGVLSSPVGATADVWEWDGVDWTDVTPPGPAMSPSPRSGHAMAELADGRIFMFGAGADAWTWDGSLWSPVTPASPVAPPPLRFHAMCFDAARNRVVVFGGLPGFLQPFVNDVWEWDGALWHHVPAPAGAAWPAARRYAAMAFDPLRGRTVLFGGQAGGLGTPYVELGDTWEWDGTNWMPAAPVPAPVPRWGAAMVFDPSTGRIVRYGGRAAPGSSSGTCAFAEPCAWDGSSWTPWTNAGVSASHRAQHVLVPGTSPGRLLVVGGRWEICIPSTPFGGGGCYFDYAPFAEISTSWSSAGGGSLSTTSAWLDLGTDRWLASGAPGLAPASLSVGQTVRFFVGGGFQRPYVVFAGPPNPGAMTFPWCGTADIGSPGINFADLVPVLTGTIDQASVNPPFIGKTWFDVTVPSALAGLGFGLQAAVIAPAGATCPLDLSGAFLVSVP